jgi:L-2-hydroxyglutarate oxidase
VSALVVPGAAVTDFARIAAAYADGIAQRGGTVLTSARVTAVVRRAGVTIVETTAGAFETRVLVNCAGLQSDAIARLDGADPGVRIVPFRGEYYVLRPGRRSLVRALIYPVPDPRFPFLGVHLTRRVGGEVEAGPNAVLALKREGYRKTDVDPVEVLGLLAYPGFLRMARRHWRSGLQEMRRSISRDAFLGALRRLVPEIGSGDLQPGGSGVRAQAVARDGSLLDDFHITRAPGRIHVLNVPSPAATASLAIGRHLATILDGML